MTKQYLSVLFLLLFAISFIGCNADSPNITEPLSSDYEISLTKSQLAGLNSYIQSISSLCHDIEQSPVFSIGYSSLKLNGLELLELRDYYPEPHFCEVNREFIILAGDSFKVEIKNCTNKYKWEVLFESDSLPDSDITLLRSEISITTDSTSDHIFIFKGETGSKGYISFIETDSTGGASSDWCHGLLIGYTINPLDKIVLEFNEVKWKYGRSPESFSTVSVCIRGTTNAYKLKGMSIGDGIPMAINVPVDNNGMFEKTYYVAFSHVPGLVLKSDSELLVYGAVGLPEIIPLNNPADGTFLKKWNSKK